MIQYSGYSGARVSTLRTHLDDVKDFEPDIVILIIGTNDLSDARKSPEAVCAEITDLIDLLLCTVGFVIIAQIFHRTLPTKPTRYPVQLDWFNNRVDEVNHRLQESCTHIYNGRARLWKCKGFWSDSAKALSFCADGCHLSNHGKY